MVDCDDDDHVEKVSKGCAAGRVRLSKRLFLGRSRGRLSSSEDSPRAYERNSYSRSSSARPLARLDKITNTSFVSLPADDSDVDKYEKIVKAEKLAKSLQNNLNDNLHEFPLELKIAHTILLLPLSRVENETILLSKDSTDNTNDDNKIDVKYFVRQSNRTNAYLNAVIKLIQLSNYCQENRLAADTNYKPLHFNDDRPYEPSLSRQQWASGVAIRSADKSRCERDAVSRAPFVPLADAAVQCSERSWNRRQSSNASRNRNTKLGRNEKQSKYANQDSFPEMLGPVCEAFAESVNPSVINVDRKARDINNAKLKMYRSKKKNQSNHSTRYTIKADEMLPNDTKENISRENIGNSPCKENENHILSASLRKSKILNLRQRPNDRFKMYENIRLYEKKVQQNACRSFRVNNTILNLFSDESFISNVNNLIRPDERRCCHKNAKCII